LIDAKQEIINRLIKNINERKDIGIENSNIDLIVNILSTNQFVANSNITRKELKKIIDDISADLVRKNRKENSL